jgi:hypothetical protein
MYLEHGFRFSLVGYKLIFKNDENGYLYEEITCFLAIYGLCKIYSEGIFKEYPIVYATIYYNRLELK